jgi:hypothetical protein
VRGIALGASGSMAASDLALAWEPPRYVDGDPYRWVVDELAPELREWLRANGIRGRPDLELLIGVGGTLLCVAGSGGAHTWPSRYGAIGSGADWALGSLHTSQRMRPRPRPQTRLRWALEASAEHCNTVSPPWTMVSSA